MEDGQQVYLVMEYLRGGELFDRIFAQKYLQESEAKAIMKVVTAAVAFLHENGVSFFCPLGIIHYISRSNIFLLLLLGCAS